MKRVADLSVSQMVVLNAVGALLMASYFLLLVHIPLHNIGHGLTFWLHLLLGIAPFALGAAISIYAHRQLEDGIASARWPNAEIDSLRGGFETVLFRGFSIALLITSVIFMFAGDHHDVGWFFMILGQGLMRLNYAFRIKPGNTPPPEDWQNRPRLQSQHWGNR